MNSTISFVLSALAIAELSLSMIGLGAPLVNPVAYQLSDASPGNLAVRAGRSGNADDFFGVVTPSPRTLPALIWGVAPGPVAKLKSVSPLTRATMEGPPPLYGTGATL